MLDSSARKRWTWRNPGIWAIPVWIGSVVLRHFLPAGFLWYALAAYVVVAALVAFVASLRYEPDDATQGLVLGIAIVGLIGLCTPIPFVKEMYWGLALVAAMMIGGGLGLLIKRRGSRGAARVR